MPAKYHFVIGSTPLLRGTGKFSVKAALLHTNTGAMKAVQSNQLSD
jgi:hypothetical protein